ncbi:MAG: ribosome-associated translation inhibitor RaiA [Tissierellia bacterium]|nr:ribosome-associated translation inhibitor RaiA [Tissierellia bacterium]
MKIKYNGKNVEVGDRLREKTEKKLLKLDKYFREDVDAHVTFSAIKNKRVVEVTIFIPGAILRAEETTMDIQESLDRVTEALERQIRKHKTKLKKFAKGETIKFENLQEPETATGEAEEHGKIVKVKRFGIKPMSSEEAVLQMELLAHDFFVYQDAETDEVRVVYKRLDGHYGLIEPEY